MGSHNNKICALFAIFIGIFSVSSSAYATYPDITGTWNGTATGVDSSCTPPSLNGPFTDQLTVVFSNQNSGNFDVSVTSTESNGSTDIDLGTGIFLSESALSFTVTRTDGGGTDTTVVNASLTSPNSASFTFSGMNSGGDFCLYSGSGSISRNSTTVVTPDVTPSSSVTDTVLFNIQMQGTISGISNHIGAALAGFGFFSGPSFTDNQFKFGGATGLNAGDGSDIAYGVWGNYSYTDYENDLSSTAFEGNNHSFLGGIDFSFWGDSILGVAFGYDIGDIDTTFNGGNQDTDSFTVAPYFGALLTDSFSVDFNVGYSRVDYDQFRTITGTTTRVTSTPHADRWFSAFNLNGIAFYNNWVLGSRVGWSYASSSIDSFTESNGTVVAESRTKVTTASIAGDVAYSFENYEPFLNLSYQRDISFRKISVTTGPQPTNDNDDILLTAGVRYFNKNGISGNLEYSKRFDRDNFDEDRVSLTVRADF